ncbi:hypothetical protein VB715_02950 [Crocosphaera sp. UHCC 0190]|nr:hypothetical protein [Crocosphaera sp. UHCC 0190]MEA5508715.1 hypothetical protein [Crocosphaera sp. UHCC 0190]
MIAAYRQQNQALSDVKSAIACYIEVLGTEILEDTPIATYQ